MFKNLDNSSMVSYLNSLETIASKIHEEKNTEKVVFFILLNLIEKLDLGYSEGYFFKYNKWDRNLKHLNSYFDLKKLKKDEVEFISTNLEKEINFYGTPMEKMLKNMEIQTNITGLDSLENYGPLNRFQNFTIIPINYENTYYGCFILDRQNKTPYRLNVQEMHILELFKYNFSLYMHSRELEDFEAEDIRLKTVGSFANSIIHELRTPISSIVGFASLAKKKLHDPKKIELYLDYILKESDKIIKLCENIGEYSSEDKNVKNKSTTFYLSSLIREVIQKLNLHLKKSKIKTYMIIENDIEITFNRDKVITAFYHIFKNSIENCDYNKNERFITIILSANNKNKISIKDNGIGIQKHRIEEVTIPFYSSKIYGTGLGLTIAKEVFTKLGFKFSIKSEYSKWTKIILKEE
ncbi:HAMP domain-containing sensor histidine kinase [Psychrilyobacter sp.]|uniref:sensor histidine kinase n=1 Tax=Psychrilyobacter sp. TaxID=2586924 RepID=UPI00301682CD